MYDSDVQISYGAKNVAHFSKSSIKSSLRMLCGLLLNSD